jgi:hypothetical protein
MCAKVELFPTFQELCADARAIEKKPLSVPARQIDGRLVLDENIGIFPREFEEYTYRYLLLDACKVERRLYREEIASEPPAPVAGERPPTPEQEMENELHRFVEAQEEQDLQAEEDRLRSLSEKQIEIPQIPNAKPGPAVPAAQEEKLVAPKAPPQQELAKPKPGPAVPAAQEEKLVAPKAPPQQELAKLREPDTEEAPPKIHSYSKLSPRLRALIEAKLKKDEEKARERHEAQESLVKRPHAAPAEEEEAAGQEEEPEAQKLGRRLRLGRPAPQLQAEEEEAPEPDEEEEESPEPEEEAGQAAPRRLRLPADAGEGQKAEKPARLLLRKPQPEEPGIGAREEEEAPEEGEHAGEEAPVPGEEEKTEAPEPEEEAGQAAPRRLRLPADAGEAPRPPEKPEVAAPEKAEPEKPESAPAQQERWAPQQSPILIKPLFPDSEKKQQAGEESDRMRRIQRIIGELSPDRARVQPVRPEDFSLDKEEEPEESEPPAEEEEKAAPEKPSDEQAKPARGRKKAAPKPAKAKKPAALKEPPQEEPEETDDEKQEPEEGEQTTRKAQPKQEAVKLRLPLRGKVLPRAAEEELQEEKRPPLSRKAQPRTTAGEEDEAPKGQTQPRETEEEEGPAQEAPARRKLTPMLPQQEPDEADDQAAPRRLKSQAEAGDEDGPAPAGKKLIPRLQPLEEPEDGEQGEEEKPAVRGHRRILPGMVRTQPRMPDTYVPPARASRPAPQEEEPGAEEEAQPRKPLRAVPQEEDEEAPEPEEKLPPAIAPLTPKKLVSEEAGQEKTPEQLAQEEKMRKMAEQLARLEAGRSKEISGTAALPVEEEDVPLPEEADDVPKPEDYGQAKEALRRSLEHEEIARKVKQEEETEVEQFAKERMVWLYEIYKMGGMSREDFLQKAAAKYSESKPGAPPPGSEGEAEAPANPALENLSKEIEKKGKK